MTARTSQTSLDRREFYVDGRWRKPAGSETHAALEAATGDLLGTAALGSPVDMDVAATAARVALDDGPWGRMSPDERADVMDRFAAALTTTQAAGDSCWPAQQPPPPRRSTPVQVAL